MDIILLDYIDKVGDKHEVVKVKNGYGRNYLIPKGLAIVANKANLAQLEGLKKQEAKKEAAKIGTYQAYADKISKATLKIEAKAGESGRLFGSVTAQNLIDAIKEQLDLEIEKRHIQMPEEVKEIGSYEATVKFHDDVVTTAKFDVVRDKDVQTGGTKAEEPKVEAAAAEVAEAVEEAAPEVVEEVAEAAADTTEDAVAEAETTEEADDSEKA
ncbi:MAG: 50S ribosomal protein L9 [Bacteroidetes bacterium]|nr:MAG: 50S ribosomal protein L9 [Bacteroidota bacterium]